LLHSTRGGNALLKTELADYFANINAEYSGAKGVQAQKGKRKRKKLAEGDS
jgi:hypothetical protein